ncbi:hypothetical protein CWN45_21320 [Klebsiella pneumoniae]|nr:hypothetical protein CWN45_21320 [Klebsiella pneumoniae]HDO6754420.1 DUF551 domain-containing protein [Klebsiella pneumoniae]
MVEIMERLLNSGNSLVIPDTRIPVCERCGDEGWVVGEMGITRCVCSQDSNSPQLPGSEPATVPGKWIPVRERMPEKGQAVLVYRPKAHEGGDSDVRVAVYGRHNFEHGFGCYWEPSHWMPLPAAPQEVGDA